MTGRVLKLTQAPGLSTNQSSNHQASYQQSESPQKPANPKAFRKQPAALSIVGYDTITGYED